MKGEKGIPHKVEIDQIRGEEEHGNVPALKCYKQYIEFVWIFQ